MPDWLFIPLVIFGYFALMKWVLPSLGVPTCMSNSCDAAFRRPPASVSEQEKKPPTVESPR